MDYYSSWQFPFHKRLRSAPRGYAIRSDASWAIGSAMESLMKKISLCVLVIVGCLILTSCLVDSSWLGLVGRWQDTEYPYIEIEFTQEGRFADYFYGEIVSYGEFVAEGDRITLHYLSLCGGENQISCDVRLRFTVTEKTLIITDSQGDILYSKVGD